MLDSLNNVAVSGGSFTEVHGNLTTYEIQHPDHLTNSRTGAGMQGLKKLYKNIAADAMHNSKERYDSPRCHPLTRRAVLRDITSWVLDRSKETSVLWLSAPAGSGKSAILQRVAEDFHNSGGLAASFFFSRTAIKRNTDTYLVSTLASQLATSIPPTRPFIERAINRDPSIFQKVLSEQMDHLVVYPLVYASLHPENGSPWPTLFVIDGLDECHGAEHQAEILSTLKLALSQLKSSLPTLYLLIASRPEPAIVTFFNDKLSDITRHIVLDDTYHPDRDIATFLRSSFYDIYHRRHTLFPSMASHKPWPPEDVISFLVRKSSGQFIFAATVVRFIDVDRRNPTTQLQLILDICGSMDSSKFAAKPFGLLDELYSQVLNSSEERKRALSILGAMLYLGNREQRPTVNFLLPLLQIDPEDATIIFWDLHSIVHVPASHNQSISFYHASFRDFLLDRHRAGNLFIDACQVHSLLLKMCIRTLSARSRKRRNLTESIIKQYSTQHWLTHYLSGDDLNPGFLDKILEESNLEIWLPKLRNSDNVSDFVSWWDDFAAMRGRFHSRCDTGSCSSLCCRCTSVFDRYIIHRFQHHYECPTVLMALMWLTLLLATDSPAPRFNACDSTETTMQDFGPGADWLWTLPMSVNNKFQLLDLLMHLLLDHKRSGNLSFGTATSTLQLTTYTHFAYVCAHRAWSDILSFDRDLVDGSEKKWSMLNCLSNVLKLLHVGNFGKDSVDLSEKTWSMLAYLHDILNVLLQKNAPPRNKMSRFKAIQQGIQMRLNDLTDLINFVEATGICQASFLSQVSQWQFNRTGTFIQTVVRQVNPAT